MPELQPTLTYHRQRQPGAVRISIVWGAISAIFGAISGLIVFPFAIIVMHSFPSLDTPFVRRCLLVFPLLGAGIFGILGAIGRKIPDSPPIEFSELLGACPECGVQSVHLRNAEPGTRERLVCMNCGTITMRLSHRAYPHSPAAAAPGRSGRMWRAD